MADDLTRAMALHGWTALWYANPYSKGTDPGSDTQYGPRWHAGVWTGPDGDLLCLRHCSTSEEAQKWLSPGGWTAEDAIAKAKEALLDGWVDLDSLPADFRNQTGDHALLGDETPEELQRKIAEGMHPNRI